MSAHGRTPLPFLDRCRTLFWALVLVAGVAGTLWLAKDPPISPTGLGWETVQGTILECYVTPTTIEGREVYWPLIRYEYVIDGRRRTSRCYGPRPPVFATEKAGVEWVAEHAPGSAVTVYYPENFEIDAVLDRDYTRKYAAFFACLGVAVLAGWRLRRQFHRNAIAYRHGAPPKEVGERTPRPIRSAAEGEVRPGHGYQGALGRMVGPTAAYRHFDRRRMP